MPTAASSTPTSDATRSGAKSSAKAGRATTLAASRKTSDRERLPEPDRTSVTRREHEAVERARLTLGRPGARQAEERGEDERDPEEAVGGVVRGVGRKREVEHDERGEDEQEHRRERLARAQLEPEILARQRHDVGAVSRRGVSCAAEQRSRVVARCSTRAGSWVETTRVALPGERRELPVEQRRALFVERGVRLVEQEQVGLVEEGAAERQPLDHPARVRRDAFRACLPETEPLEQHPDALPPLRHAVQRAVELEVLERRELAVDERLVPEVPDPPAVGRSTVSLPAVGAASPASRRSSVVFPEPFGPVTTRLAPASSEKVTSRRTRFVP